jgi:hypothetical protein
LDRNKNTATKKFKDAERPAVAAQARRSEPVGGDGERAGEKELTASSADLGVSAPRFTIWGL